MNTITISAVAALAQFEFRRFGFRADNPTIESRGKREAVIISFDKEPATGQAAFSQSEVIPYVRIWHQTAESTLLFMDHEIPLLEKDRTQLELCISYAHHGSGKNGISRRYQLVRHPFDEYTPILEAAR